MPSEVYNTSIVLTHWGRLGLDHKSNTAYDADNYNLGTVWPGYQDIDWRELYKGHACYDPRKDLIIPPFKPPHHFQSSPLLGAPALERDILFYFRGDVGLHRQDHFSRGIRQKYYRCEVHPHSTSTSNHNGKYRYWPPLPDQEGVCNLPPPLCDAGWPMSKAGPVSTACSSARAAPMRATMGNTCHAQSSALSHQVHGGDVFPT